MALRPFGVADGLVARAAARLVHPGDVVILIAYGQMETAEAKELQPHVVFVDGDNRIMATGLDPAETFDGPGLVRGDTTATRHGIAFDLGFHSSAYFTQVFRKLTGMTPSEYRARYVPAQPTNGTPRPNRENAFSKTPRISRKPIALLTIIPAACGIFETARLPG